MKKLLWIIPIAAVAQKSRSTVIWECTHHSGDYCVFRANPAGSRQDKIVLVEHHSYYDDDYVGAYSIKKYTSSKSYDESGNWQHEKIELKPLNQEYSPIILTSDDADEFRVIGEFVNILK